MRKRPYILTLIGMGILTLPFLLPVGCEDNAEPDDWGTPDPTGALSIVPSSVDLMDESASFTAQGGGGPYAWRVSDSTLGGITDTSDSRATYTRQDGKVGINQVILSDSHGRTVSATVNQTGADYVALSVTATPSSLASNQMTSALVATGGAAPYRWSVLESALGQIISVSGDTYSALYGRSRQGNNVVSVEDSNGTVATVTITQP